jgi:hypothetical protein
MEDNPAEPSANLAAGRYLCFVKGNWQRGVPYLALGSDAELKAVAIEELRGANSAERQAAIGDDWWDAAEARQGEERNTLRLRAGFWYHTAGQIRWQCSGTISKDGRIEATLIHTQAPATWGKLQARVAQLAPDGNTIQGQAMAKNTTHDFTWIRSNRPQPSAGAK